MEDTMLASIAISVALTCIAFGAVHFTLLLVVVARSKE
jgi:hypothetical protein